MGLDSLLRYESAGVALRSVEKEPELAVSGMSDYYKNILGKYDPIINRALQEAAEGIERGAGITNIGVVKSIDTYGKKYEEEFVTTKLSDLIGYLTFDYNLAPKRIIDNLTKYKEYTLLDLNKMLKDKDSKEDKREIKKAITAVELLKRRRFKAKILNIVDNETILALEALYQEKPKSETEEAEYSPN